MVSILWYRYMIYIHKITHMYIHIYIYIYICIYIYTIYIYIWIYYDILLHGYIMDQITMETPTRLWIKVRLWIYEIDDMDIHSITYV